MKNVTIETKYNELKEIAKNLGIKFNGVKAVVLVEEINAKLAEAKAPKAKKTLEEVGLAKGQHVQVDGAELTGRAKNLNGRVAQIEEITGRGFVRVTLINNKNGELQGCLVRMPVTALVEIEAPVMAAV